MRKKECECTDPGCDSCGGQCHKIGSVRLWRVDMEDWDGTLFCEGCADDAMGCGVFTDKSDEGED